MSSWSGTRSYAKKKGVIPTYYKMNYGADIFSGLLNYLGAHIYSQKMGERCHVYDQVNLLGNIYRQHPQVNYLKEVPDDSTELSVSGIQSITNNLRFVDIQKYAATLFEYRPDFNQSVIEVLGRNNIKGLFDIGIHLVPDASGSFAHYIPLLQAYQKKSRKVSLNLFVMAQNLAEVSTFQKLADPTWRVSHLLRVVPKSADEAFIVRMAEVQVMSAQRALFLDYNQPIDRYIYLMHRNVKEMEYLSTTTTTPWSLV